MKSDASNAIIKNFSREFKKPLFHDLDRRFLTIFFCSIVFEIVVVFLLARRPVPEYSDREIAKIQERFAQFVLGETLVGRGDVMTSDLSTSTQSSETDQAGEGDEEVGDGIEESGTGTDEGSGSGEGDGDRDDGGRGPLTENTAENRMSSRIAAAETRRRTREAISGQVSNKGILGLLTGTGSAASGDAVSGILPGGSDSAIDDLDQILSSVDGLRSNGGSGSGGGGGGTGSSVRGGRSGRKADIDDLVSDAETVRMASMSRKGALTVEAPSEVAGTARKSVARSPNAIHEVLLGHISAIRYCYERELKRNPELKGKVTVRITVAPEGSVRKAEIVSSTVSSTRVERCILSRIRLWKDFQPIAPDEGDVTFRQVYAFGY